MTPAAWPREFDRQCGGFPGQPRHTFSFDLGSAILGALIHMMVGARYGVAFALVVRAAWLSGLMTLAVAGTARGAVVFVVSSFVGLPIAAVVLNSDDQIADMASLVVYGTFLTEHLMSGLAVGLFPAACASRAAH